MARKSRNGAFSLVEAVITVALIGFIVLGIVPLFHRAVMSNIYGADASQMTAFSRAGLESLLQRTANSTTFFDDATAEGDEAVGELFRSGTNVIRYQPSYYDTGARLTVGSGSGTQTIGLDREIGDEQWRNDPAAVQGAILWRAYIEKREYNFADVNFGTIDPNAEGTLVQEGHPKLFDTPQPIFDSGTAKVAGYSGGDISELRMIVESGRATESLVAVTERHDNEEGNTGHVAMSPTGIQQRIVVGLFRVF